MGAVVPTFSEWESFYVIIGSSAAALTGLQFVVIVLTADIRGGGTRREISAFATPTIIHFGAVLLLSGILTAPWHAVTGPAVLIVGGGITGLVYTILVVKRARRTDYTPVLEDWLFHAVLPAIAYSLLAGGGLKLPASQHAALFVVATAALLLLFTGIHNAWDIATYLVAKGHKEKQNKPEEAQADAAIPPS
jgi:hypothetical protein